MNLTDQQIQEFIEAWQKDFGETLSFDAARAEATRLLDFFVQMQEMLRSPQTLATEGSEWPITPATEDTAVKKAWKKMMRRKYPTEKRVAW